MKEIMLSNMNFLQVGFFSLEICKKYKFSFYLFWAYQVGKLTHYKYINFMILKKNVT